MKRSFPLDQPKPDKKTQFRASRMKLFKDYQMNQIVKIFLGAGLIGAAIGVLGGALKMVFPESAYNILLAVLGGTFIGIFISYIKNKKP